MPVATEPGSGSLLVFFGLIATGKSTLAAAWAEQAGCSYHNSDRVRKELAGLAPQERQREGMNQGIYTSEFSRRTYDRLLELAEQDLAEHPGGCVVLDGSYQSRAERDRLRERLARSGRSLIFVHCVCDEDEMRRRMAVRAKDPTAVSDGRWEVYLGQKERFQPPDELGEAELIAVETRAPLAELLAGLARRLERVKGKG